MKSILAGLLLISATISSSAYAENLQYKADRFFVSIAATISLKIPDNFTGTIIDELGAQELYGDLVPSDVFVTRIFSNDGSGIGYVNTPEGVLISISPSNLGLGGKDTYFTYDSGVLTGWSLHAWDKVTGKSLLVNDSVGGTWIAVAVPEPTEYAMLGLGLGVLGFATSRRRKTLN